MTQDLVVLILPAIIDGVNRFAKTQNQKLWIAYITSAFIAILVNANLVQTIFMHFTAFTPAILFTGLALIAHVLLVVLGTQGVYLKFWEPTKIHDALVPNTPIVPKTGDTVSTPLAA